MDRLKGAYVRAAMGLGRKRRETLMCNQNSEGGLVLLCPAALLACIAISPFYLAGLDKGPALSPVYAYFAFPTFPVRHEINLGFPSLT